MGASADDPDPGMVFLFSECVLPGCHTLVATLGEPCQGCRDAFGDMLVSYPDRPPLTAADIAERDRATRAAYADHARIRREMGR